MRNSSISLRHKLPIRILGSQPYISFRFGVNPIIAGGLLLTELLADQWLRKSQAQLPVAPGKALPGGSVNGRPANSRRSCLGCLLYPILVITIVILFFYIHGDLSL